MIIFNPGSQKDKMDITRQIEMKRFYRFQGCNAKHRSKVQTSLQSDLNLLCQLES